MFWPKVEFIHGLSFFRLKFFGYREKKPALIAYVLCSPAGKSIWEKIVILWSSRGTWWVHKMKHDLVTQVEFVLLALRMVRIPEVVARHKG